MALLGWIGLALVTHGLGWLGLTLGRVGFWVEARCRQTTAWSVAHAEVLNRSR